MCAGVPGGSEKGLSLPIEIFNGKGDKHIFLYMFFLTHGTLCPRSEGSSKSCG